MATPFKQAFNQLNAKISLLEGENKIIQEVVNTLSAKAKELTTIKTKAIEKAKIKALAKYRGDKAKFTQFLA